MATEYTKTTFTDGQGPAIDADPATKAHRKEQL